MMMLVKKRALTLFSLFQTLATSECLQDDGVGAGLGADHAAWLRA
jgi:hypothetical protein